MNRSSRIFTVAFLSFAFLFLFLPSANAYLDPGTGSFLFQALVGAILAAGLTAKLFWRKFVAFLTRRARPADDA